MPTKMQKMSNGWYSCPRCGRQKRHTLSSSAFFYSMGKFSDDVKMECRCIEQETKKQKK